MAAGKGTILVVDDDPDVRDTLRLALEIEGYEVRSAGTGREALARLEEGLAPSLILLDLMMPVMNGPEFLGVIRADPRFENLPVVVVTAFSQMVRELRGRKLWVQGYLEKPISLEALLSTAGRICGREGVADGASA